jgi:polar amino acid transport system substrate-binding protein
MASKPFTRPIAFAAVILTAASSVGIGSMLLPFSLSAEGRATPLPLPDDIVARGVLRIGVDHAPTPPTPADYQTRREDGLEAVMRDAIGKTLGIAVQMITVDTADRQRALASGDVDALMVQRSSLSPRANDAGDVVIDAGYGSGLQAIMRSDTPIRSWADLRGRTVCVSETKYAARALVQSIGAVAVTFHDPAKSLAAMRSGACDAALHDEAMISGLIKTERWQKFSATLPPRAHRQMVIVTTGQSAATAMALGRLARIWRETDRWSRWIGTWAADVDFEAYLEQDAPDCH